MSLVIMLTYIHWRDKVQLRDLHSYLAHLGRIKCLIAHTIASIRFNIVTCGLHRNACGGVSSSPITCNRAKVMCCTVTRRHGSAARSRKQILQLADAQRALVAGNQCACNRTVGDVARSVIASRLCLESRTRRAEGPWCGTSARS
jgi:hypothetical protein